MSAQFCGKCGAPLREGARACGQCGQMVDSTANTRTTVPNAAGADVRGLMVGGNGGGQGAGAAATATRPRLVEARLTAADGTVHELTEAETYLGRGPTNTIPVDSTGVSRQHARITTDENGQLMLEDLGSTNGTFVNGRQLTALHPLEDGDVIRFGPGGEMTLSLRRLAGASERDARDSSTRETVVLSLPPKPGAAASGRVATEPIIALRNVVKTYKSGETQVTILKSVSLEINKGSFVALLGPSGCGKTTTLNMIIGIDRPDQGEIVVGDQAVHKMSENQLARWRGRNIGIVFQFFQLLPTLSVIENVMMPMHFTKTFAKNERRQRAMDLLGMIGMEDRAHRLPSALSGGQQQRVAIARALACDAPILVADEPTGNLDSKTSQQVFDLFLRLNSEGKTIVMVTHDPVLARAIPQRIEMLDGEVVG